MDMEGNELLRVNHLKNILPDPAWDAQRSG